jgi:hypothetical protein
MVPKVFVPHEATDSDQSQLHEVHQCSSLVPTVNVRQLATRANSLEEEERQRHDADKRSRKELFEKLRGHDVDFCDA